MRNDLPPNGFTLVEVLVALVVTSLLLGVVMNGTIKAAQRETRSAEKRAALLLAREELAQAATRPSAPGITRGTEGELDWQLTETAAAADPSRRAVLAGLSITISGSGATPLLTAETRKLKPVDVQ